MRRGSLSPGNLVAIRERTYRVCKLYGDGRIEILALDSGVAELHPKDHLFALYRSGEMSFLGKDVDRTERTRATPLFLLSEGNRSTIEARKQLLAEMDRRAFKGWNRKSEGGSHMTKALAEVCVDLGIKPISVATYYRWKGNLEATGDSASLLRKPTKRKERSEVHRVITDAMAGIIERARYAKKPHFMPLTISSIKADCVNAIMANHRTLAVTIGSPQTESAFDFAMRVAPKSDNTWRRLWSQFPAIDRSLVERGKGKTRELFRGGRGTSKPPEILDRVEYDETKLPLFVIDDELGAPLGRPTLGWFIDGHSGLPVGLSLGFEEGSDFSLTSALRDCCTPKTHLVEEFGLKHDYPVFGIPRLMVFDNGTANHANTIAQLTKELRNEHWFAPTRTGWFKALVEGSFRTLNAQLLSNMPGYKHPDVAAFDYDPIENGCIGLEALYHILWKYVVEVVSIDKHPVFGIRRIDVWNESFARCPPSYLSSFEDASLIFSVIREGKVSSAYDHNGVIFEGLRYYCDEMDRFRHLYGHKGRVLVRVNPSDLSKILIAKGNEGPWYHVESVDPEYTNRLSIHQHRAIAAFSNAKWGRDDQRALNSAKQELQTFIKENAPPNALRAKSLAAKVAGITSADRFAEPHSVLNLAGRIPLSNTDVREIAAAPVPRIEHTPIPSFQSDASLRVGRKE